MSESQSLTIDVVSDVCCPWCYLGKRRLDKALAELGDIDVTLTYRPFQLDPTIPAEGHDRKAYMAAKFPDAGHLKAVHERLAEFGRADGIHYDFEAIEKAPNSLDAHRVLHWSLAEGRQVALKERLMALYWTEGADIGSAAVLASAAADVGMNSADVARRLATDEDRAEVQAEIARYARMGVRGVPTFILDNKYAVAGAQEVATLIDAIRDVAAEKAGS
ncbi:MAG: DsbA family oxidoreductase [Ancalomicrobiaceae bacterium]|nr:DsbA family oxidoreductase [Ancalomicrobiaceae bacterium]